MLLCILSVLGFGMLNQVHSQESDNFNFQILINDDNNMIELYGIRGCAWTKLTFSLVDNETKFINSNNVSVVYDSTPKEEWAVPNTLQQKLPEFTIAIRKLKNEIQLVGYNGTEWEEWSYKCKDENCLIYVNKTSVGLFPVVWSELQDQFQDSTQ